MPAHVLNLVAPLSHKPTVMHTSESTATPMRQSLAARSGAMDLPIDVRHLRQSHFLSATELSTAPTTPGIRASKTATRTSTTRTTPCAFVPSADSSHSQPPADLLERLALAYAACRRHKRSSASCRAFEAHLETNLLLLANDLREGTYQPGLSICFVITRPKPREVWAAQFRDRIVHHLLYNHIAPRFLSAFIANSCACIPGKGTLFAARTVEQAIRSASHNWSNPAHYLKCDLANFFVSINKDHIASELAKKIHETWWLALALQILYHDPRPGAVFHSRPQLMALVPPHKSLLNAPERTGLPIGNLSSQFFANVHLNALDQFIKHQIKAKHYTRYVDDFILIHESSVWLREAHGRIQTWLPQHLGAQLNPSKTIAQPVHRGVDFAGHFIQPWRRTLRRRTVHQAIAQIEAMPSADVFSAGNSYLGLARQASHPHQDQAHIAKALRRRGHAVSGDLKKVYPK